MLHGRISVFRKVKLQFLLQIVVHYMVSSSGDF